MKRVHISAPGGPYTHFRKAVLIRSEPLFSSCKHCFDLNWTRLSLIYITPSPCSFLFLFCIIYSSWESVLFDINNTFILSSGSLQCLFWESFLIRSEPLFYSQNSYFGLIWTRLCLIYSSPWPLTLFSLFRYFLDDLRDLRMLKGFTSTTPIET